jgi:hypothetical protein
MQILEAVYIFLYCTKPVMLICIFHDVCFTTLLFREKQCLKNIIKTMKIYKKEETFDEIFKLFIKNIYLYMDYKQLKWFNFII